MKPSLIEHIGIAVSNLDNAINFYENILGLKCYNIEEVPDQKVRTAFFMVGQTKIELLEPTAPDGPIGRFIEKRGEGPEPDRFSENLEGREKIPDRTFPGFRMPQPPIPEKIGDRGGQASG